MSEFVPFISSVTSDYRPDLDEVAAYEQVFGDLLAVGHSVAQAANFLIHLGNGDVEPDLPVF